MMSAMSKPTALVTGASTGIGRVFSQRLAARGHDLVVVARNEGALKDLAEELHDSHGADVEVLPADLTLPDQLHAVEQRAAAGVDLLVNNAGFGTKGRFVELPIEREDEEIRLNVIALVRLTRAALPTMTVAGRGGVINVASIGAFLPGPSMAVYSATKAFVLSFTEALSEELRGTGVKVQALCPGFTETEFQGRAGVSKTKLPKILWTGVEEVVDASLRDFDRGRTVSPLQAGYGVHAPHPTKARAPNVGVERPRAVARQPAARLTSSPLAAGRCPRTAGSS
jgi:short-subunit dehydrogenase